MPFVIAAVMLSLWMAIAYREYQRGDLLLAGVCAVVGVLLAVYRLKAWQARQAARRSDKPPL